MSQETAEIRIRNAANSIRFALQVDDATAQLMCDVALELLCPGSMPDQEAICRRLGAAIEARRTLIVEALRADEETQIAVRRLEREWENEPEREEDD